MLLLGQVESAVQDGGGDLSGEHLGEVALGGAYGATGAAIADRQQADGEVVVAQGQHKRAAAAIGGEGSGERVVGGNGGGVLDQLGVPSPELGQDRAGAGHARLDRGAALGAAGEVSAVAGLAVGRHDA